MIRVIITWLTVSAAMASATSLTSVSIYYDPSTKLFTKKFGSIDDTAAAWARLDSAYNTTGWAKLEVQAHSDGEEHVHFAAGLAEGSLTCKLVAAVASNNDDTSQNDAVVNYTAATEAWTRQQAAANQKSSDYWRVVQQILNQFDGLVQGYQQSECHVQHPLSQSALWLMNMDGDLEDLKNKFRLEALKASTGASTGAKMVDPMASVRAKKPQHCSGLTKWTGDDVIFGHATWDIYSNMAPRIFKHYALPVQRGNETLRHQVHFSSTGPWLSSVDDFYTVSGTAELGVIETSNTVLNETLYDLVQPQSMLCWLRSIVANRLAVDGADWARLFGKYHSGTYTNQWQVLDMSRFTPHADKLQPGLLTVLEEVPGLVHFEDMTEHLQTHSYWPSYNVPYFDIIRARNGDTPNSWHTAPRASLFKMFEGNITDMAGMQHVMRWNNYTSTPAISGGDPCNAIACRSDVRSPGSHPLSAFGAIDAKTSSYKTMFPSAGSVNTLKVYAEAGPTHDELSVFCWSTADYTISGSAHALHVDCFNFTWDAITPMQGVEVEAA